MEHYERMRRMGCLTRHDLEEMAGSRQALPTLLTDYQRKGIIERIRRNLYAVVDLESQRPVLSRYQIGSRLFPDACISHRSAFEALGYVDRPSHDIYVVTKSRFTDFKYNGVFYRHVDMRAEISAEWVDGARVTTLEQTIVDSIHNFEKIAGLEEVVRCILRAPRPDAEKLLLCLERAGNECSNLVEHGAELSMWGDALGADRPGSHDGGAPPVAKRLRSGPCACADCARLPVAGGEKR